MKVVNLCFASLLLVSSVFAQDSKKPFTLNVNVDLVEVHVSVVDEKDRTVGGLSKDHFKIFENRIEQPIAVFKHEDIPLSLGLVIDNSRSIEPRKQRLDAAALSFVQQSNKDDETFIVHFDSDVRLSQDFTSNLADLQQTLASTKPFGQTAIYDAVMTSIRQMDKAKHDKHVLLVITDGEDNVSNAT
jgi:VWFA-related protein